MLLLSLLLKSVIHVPHIVLTINRWTIYVYLMDKMYLRIITHSENDLSLKNYKDDYQYLNNI